jgi:hypothetical protein
MKINVLRTFLRKMLRKAILVFQKPARKEVLPQEVLDLINCPIGGYVRVMKQE